MKFLYLSILSAFLFSCSPKIKMASEKENFYYGFKTTVFMSILKGGGLQELYQKDATTGGAWEVLNDPEIGHYADSIGQVFGRDALRLEIPDTDKKAVISRALDYYTSKYLDSITRHQYKIYKKHRKEFYEAIDRANGVKR